MAHAGQRATREEVLAARVIAFSVGFFGAHSIANGWVGQRALTARAQASALYLLCYYLGSSVFGSVGGLAYEHEGWPGVVAMVAGLLLLALIATTAVGVASSMLSKNAAHQETLSSRYPP